MANEKFQNAINEVKYKFWGETEGIFEKGDKVVQKYVVYSENFPSVVQDSESGKFFIISEDEGFEKIEIKLPIQEQEISLTDFLVEQE